MLCGVGFRRFLPITNFILYLALMWAADGEYYRDLVNPTPRLSYLAVAQGIGGQWDPVYIDRPYPIAARVAVLINLPAVNAAFPVGYLIGGWRGELAVYIIGTVLLLPLWYCVGLGIDRRLGLVSMGPAITSRLGVVLTTSCAVLSGICIATLLIGAFAFGTIIAVRDADLAGGLLMLIPAVLLSIWPAIVFAFSFSNLRRVRGRHLNSAPVA